MEPPLAAAVSTAMQRTAILTDVQYSAQIVPGTGEVIAKEDSKGGSVAVRSKQKIAP